jgi:hypothetical protein
VLNEAIQLYGPRTVWAGLAAVLSSGLTPVSLLGFSILLGQEKFEAAADPSAAKVAATNNFIGV